MIAVSPTPSQMRRSDKGVRQIVSGSDPCLCYPAYPHQRVLFVAVDGYAVAVPYVTDGETKFLKTAFHSRRATRIYLGG